MKIRFKNEWKEYQYENISHLLGVSVRRLNRSMVKRLNEQGEPIIELCYLQLVNFGVLGLGVEIQFHTYPSKK
jgi:hypothetical protein